MSGSYYTTDYIVFFQSPTSGLWWMCDEYGSKACFEDPFMACKSLKLVDGNVAHVVKEFDGCIVIAVDADDIAVILKHKEETAE